MIARLRWGRFRLEGASACHLYPTGLELTVLALIAAGCRPGAGDSRATHLAALVGAERAFAAMAMAQGQREAWLHWFAPAGLMYRQGRFVNARRFMGQDDPDPTPAGPGRAPATRRGCR